MNLNNQKRTFQMKLRPLYLLIVACFCLFNGKLSAQKYDWQVVAEQIEHIYEMAISSGDKVRLSSENRFWSRR